MLTGRSALATQLAGWQNMRWAVGFDITIMPHSHHEWLSNDARVPHLGGINNISFSYSEPSSSGSEQAAKIVQNILVRCLLRCIFFIEESASIKCIESTQVANKHTKKCSLGSECVGRIRCCWLNWTWEARTATMNIHGWYWKSLFSLWRLMRNNNCTLLHVHAGQSTEKFLWRKIRAVTFRYD